MPHQVMCAKLNSILTLYTENITFQQDKEYIATEETILTWEKIDSRRFCVWCQYPVHLEY